MFDFTRIPRISRFFTMRRESDKVAFAYVPHQSLRTGKLHPCEAVLLALIDGRRNWGEIIAASAQLSDLGPEDAAQMLEKVIRRIDPQKQIVVETDTPSRCFEPQDFLVPADKVNLNSRFEAPLSMIFKVTSRCKTDCVYCYAPRYDASWKRELPLERVKEILREARELGVAQVNLCGGDGFARGDFVDIVETCLELDLVTDISTKIPLAPDQAERLAKNGLDYLQVSIDSCLPEISDQMTGRPGHLDRLIKSVKTLKKAGVYIRTNTVVTRHNVSTIPDTVRMLAELGVDNMKITPAFESFHVGDDSFLLSEEEAARLEDGVNKLRQEWAQQGVQVLYSRLKPANAMSHEEKERFWFSSRGACSGGRSAFFVSPEGKVTLCEQVPHEPPFVVGDLTKQTILEIWNAPETLAIAYPERTQFAGTLCYTCSDFETCAVRRGHCFRDSWFANDRLCGPSPYCPHVSDAAKESAPERVIA